MESIREEGTLAEISRKHDIAQLVFIRCRAEFIEKMATESTGHMVCDDWWQVPGNKMRRYWLLSKAFANGLISIWFHYSIDAPISLMLEYRSSGLKAMHFFMISWYACGTSRSNVFFEMTW